MVDRISITDSMQEMVDKINKTMDLSTVDGGFSVKSTDGLKITINGGIIRSGSQIIEIPEKTITLNPSRQYTIGVLISSESLESYSYGSEPEFGFIPVLKITTNNISVSGIDDLRTWAASEISTYDVPVGSIIVYSGTSIPSGFLEADGSTYSIENYPELFDAIGDMYGGDGVTTFSVPDAYTELPSITTFKLLIKSGV